MSEEAADFASFVESNGSGSEQASANSEDSSPDLAQLADQIIKEQQSAPPADQKTEESTPKDDQKPVEQAKPEEKPAEAKATERAEEFKRKTTEEKARLEEKNARAELRKAREELARYKALEEKIKTDPLAALEDDLKVPYSKLTDAHIQRLEKDPTDPKLSSLEKRLADAEKRLAEREAEVASERQKATIANHEATIREQIVKSEDLTYLPEYGDEGVELVRELVTAHFVATSVRDEYGRIIEPGEVMPESEAIKLAEDHYTKQAQKLEAAKAKKAPKKAPEPSKPQPESKPKPTTLSADMQRSAQQQPLTARDELAEQLEWLKQQGAQM